MGAVRVNQVKRDKVKLQESRIQLKLRKREEERKKRYQLHYSMRVEDQKKIANQVIHEVNVMEKEEKEILERLKNSQRMEQMAYQDLEKAIKTSVDSADIRKKHIGQKRRLPITKPVRSQNSPLKSESVYSQSLH